MRSHLATNRLSAYLDDELPHREQRLVEAHVAQCTVCRGRLHGLRLVVSELQRVPAVEAPPTLARRIETEAAMRWGPRSPRGPRLLGRRGTGLLQDMIQLSAVTAASMAMIGALLTYAASLDARQGLSAEALADEVPASPDRAVVAGRSFVFRDRVWWQESLVTRLGPSRQLAPTIAMQDALARAPWIASLLRRGPVVFELDGSVQVVELATSVPRPRR
jgi:anti-sigma factor RsiW